MIGEQMSQVDGGNSPQTIRILVVDDYPIVRQALRAMIEGEPDMEVVGEASEGMSALPLARDLAPAVVIMDVDMPVMDGIEATRRIVAETPQIRVLAYSATEDSESVAQMFEAGAVDLVSKRTRIVELLGRVRDVARVPAAHVP